MRVRKVRDTQGQPIEDFREGDDGVRAVDQLFRYGRSYPRGKPTQKDYQSRDPAPHSQAPTPHPDEYAATFRPARNSNVSPAPDESPPQFPCSKVADHVDVGQQWTRGYGSEPHPHFDSNVDNKGRAMSGNRYDSKSRK